MPVEALHSLNTIVEDDDLLIRELPGQSDVLVVAFTGIGLGLGGIQKEEFVGTASGRSQNHVLFVTDRQRSWYSAPGLMKRIILMVRQIARKKKARRVITLGNSMGGYGALLFADQLGADVAIAISPQFTLRPNIINERRWATYTKDLDPRRLRTAAPTEGSRVTRFAIFGAEDEADKPHATELERSGGTHLFRIAGADHMVAGLLKRKGLLEPVIAAMMQNDVAKAGQILEPIVAGGWFLERRDATGRCLCGAVRVRATVASPAVQACHCVQCQRWTGGGPLTSVRVKDLLIEGEDAIATYHASEWGERAFCGRCGSTLFWRMRGKPVSYIAAGLLDDQTGLRLAEEIFVDHRPDWIVPGAGATQSTEAEELAKLHEFLEGEAK